MRLDPSRPWLALPWAIALSLLLACGASGTDDESAGGSSGTGPAGGSGGAGGTGGTGGGGGVDPYEVRESAEVAALRESTGLTFAECGVTTRVCGDGGCTAPACEGEDQAYECLAAAFAACTPAHLQDRVFPYETYRVTTDFFVVLTDSACELVAIYDTREAGTDCMSLERYTCPVYPVADCELNRAAMCDVESLLARDSGADGC